MGIGHGKLLLFGEHAVVHGHPAVGIGCNLYTSLFFEADFSKPAPGTSDHSDGDSHPGPGGSGKTRGRALPLDIAGLRLDVYGIAKRDGTSLANAISRGLSAVGRDGGIPDGTTTILVDSTVPRGVGLGSSAALCAAIADALYTHGGGTGQRGAPGNTPTPAGRPGNKPGPRGLSGAATEPGAPSRLETIASLAHDIEHLYHGKPSGVDTTLSVYGGVRAFSRGGPGADPDRPRGTAGGSTLGAPGANTGHPSGTPDGAAAQASAGARSENTTGSTTAPRSWPLSPGSDSPVTLLYGYVPRSGNTKELVARISAALSRRDRDTVERIAELGRLSEAAIAEIDARKPDAKRLGTLAWKAQEALSALGLSTSEIDTVLAAGRRAGARGGKLSGAGGGGAWFLLFDDPDHAEAGRTAILEDRPDTPVFTMPLVPAGQM